MLLQVSILLFLREKVEDVRLCLRRRRESLRTRWLKQPSQGSALGLPWNGQEKVRLVIWEIDMDAIEVQLRWKGKECGLHSCF